MGGVLDRACILQALLPLTELVITYICMYLRFYIVGRRGIEHGPEFGSATEYHESHLFLYNIFHIYRPLSH